MALGSISQSQLLMFVMVALHKSSQPIFGLLTLLEIATTPAINLLTLWCWVVG